MQASLVFCTCLGPCLVTVATAQTPVGWISSTTRSPYPPGLNIGRYNVACVSGTDGTIYAIGGVNSSAVLSTIEVYSPSNPSAGWTVLAHSLNTARFGLAAAVDTSGNIYAIGGQNASGAYLTSVEVYNPSNPSAGWTVLTHSLNTARYNVAATTGADGKIYVLAGLSSGNTLNTVEVYNPSNPSTGWTYLASSLNTARRHLAATADLSGNLYAIAGYNDSSGYLNTVEVYNVNNPSAGWTYLKSGSTQLNLNTARQGLAAATGRDGKVYAIAGSAAANLTSVEVYNPSNSSAGWVYLQNGSAQLNLNTARYGFGAVTGQDGRIYAIGGQNDTSGAYLSTVEEFDPAANAWSYPPGTPHLLEAYEDLVGTSGQDGNLYILGGFYFTPSGQYSNIVYAYNPKSDTVTTISSMKTARSGLTAVTGSDGKIYAIGGSNGSYLNTVEVYDPSNPGAGWNYLSYNGMQLNLKTTLVDFAATTGLDGKIYAIGGYNGSAYVNTVQVYDPANPSAGWTYLAHNLNTARGTFAAAVDANGKIYAIAGYNSSFLAVNTVEVYDPSNPSAGWTYIANLNNARNWHTAVTGQDGRIYAIGGYIGSSPSNTVEMYDPNNATGGWTTLTPTLNKARGGFAAALASDGRIFAFAGRTSSGGDLSTLESYRPTAPTTIATLSGTSGANGWYTSNVTLTLSATDNWGPGVQSVRYAQNGGSLTSVSGSSYAFPTFTAEGVTSVQADALDTLGNVGAFVSTSVKIDKTPPVSTLAIANNKVVLTATDNLSGVASTTYSVDGGANQSFVPPLVFSLGDANLHTISYFSTDVAGNVETSHSAFVCDYPYLFSLSPTSVTAGSSGFTLAVNGINFDPTCQVAWNGVNLTTRYSSPNQLLATVPAADVATAGSASVGVTSTSNGSAAYPQIFVIDAGTGKARLTSTIALSRATDGTHNILVALTLKNVGAGNATNVKINSATLTDLTSGGSAINTLTSLPLNVGTISAGSSTLVTLTFPAGVGNSGDNSRLLVRGTESATNFGVNTTKTLP
jgi:hypothetical protein